MREPLEPDPGHAGGGKPNGRAIDGWAEAASQAPGKRLFSMGATDKIPAAIDITLNGEPYRLEGDPRLIYLIAELKMKPTRIAVELNREVIPKARYDQVTLKAGDELEIINFVGGG
jgi:sulfur carrier protein